MLKIIVIIVTIVKYVVSTSVEINHKGSDFSVISKSPYYVDKTSLIKEFFMDTARPLIKTISAPSGYGKSTVVDMIDKFASIVLNDKDEPILPNRTENYKLFCDPPLDVCRDDLKFVDEHLGRYPVIRIDYEPLKNIVDYESTVDALKSIVAQSFGRYSYLHYNRSLYRQPEAAVRFAQHCLDSTIGGIDELDVEHSFRYLSKLLRQHHDRRVIVVQDNYDADCRGIVFLDISQIPEATSLLYGLRRLLLENNQENLEKAIAFGITSVKDRNSRVPGDVDDCEFLGDHPYTRYFGLTELEIDRLLETVAGKFAGKTKNEMKNDLERYRSNSRDNDPIKETKKTIKLYQTSAVMRYLERNTKL